MPMLAERGNAKECIKVRQLNENEFASLEAPWEKLLAQSHADALFMSWPWLYSWWEVWSRSLNLELILLGAYTEQGELVGIGPFYRHRYRAPIGFSLQRLHVIGNAWRISPTVRTEYCGIIARKDLEESVQECLFSALLAYKWQEMVICDVPLSEWTRWQRFLARKTGVMAFPRAHEYGVRIDARSDFEGWLASLGPNTRLKLYNRRKYLSRKGELVHREWSPDNAQNFLSALNEFHRLRWSKPCFDEDSVSFHHKLLTRLGKGQVASLSVLEHEGQTISLLYDIRAGKTTYNIQSGYFEDFDPKVALGTLHLGYAIEQSFTRENIQYYDLLAGFGKNTFYKGRLQGEEVEFHTIQLVRPALLRWGYKIQFMLPHRWRQSLNRLFRL